MEFNPIEKKIAHLVKKEKIAESGDYNLSGDRYKETMIYSGKWDFVELGEIAEILGGYAFKSSELKNEKLSEEYLPVIKIGNLTREGRIDLSSIQYYKYNKSLYKYLIFKEDILIAMTGATVGKVSVSNKEKLLLNQRVGRIRGSKNRISKKYLKDLLLRNLFYDYCQKIAGGGAQGNISPNKILSFKIPLPPLEIQEQIVNELESYQKIIDGAGQIVENYKPTFKIDPEWKWIEIENISNSLEYGYSETAKDNGDYRFIRITDISENGLLRDNEIKYVSLNEKSKNYILKKGDILVARTGATYGKTLYFDREIKAIFAGYLIRINFDKEIINPRYFWIFSQSPEYLKQKYQLVQGGGQPQFNANVIKKIKVPLPTIELQEKIISKIENEQKIVDSNKELVKIYEQKIKDKIAEVWGE